MPLGGPAPRIAVEIVDAEALPVCLAIRREVFVEGQGVPEALEIDGADSACTHFLARLGGDAVGTARLHETVGHAKAERVAVRQPHRGCGVGRALMAALESEVAARGFAEILLHAQEAVVVFYQRLGYAVEGAPFLEAGIPHRAMRKKL